MSSLLLLSGGMDSAAIAATFREHLDGALFVDYGQPHARHERECAVRLAARFSLPLTETSVGLQSVFSDSIVVPARNATLICLAANHGATKAWIGCCRHDYEVFEDCRSDYLSKLGTALGIAVESPLVQKSKLQIRAMLGELVTETWSCYFPAGDSPCNTCSACRARISDG